VNVYEGDYVAGIEPSGAASPGKARQPTPGNEDVIVPTQAVLQWKAGQYAVLHDVYFGESREEVEAATRDNTKVFVGRQPTKVLSVAPPAARIRPVSFPARPIIGGSMRSMMPIPTVLGRAMSGASWSSR